MGKLGIAVLFSISSFFSVVATAGEYFENHRLDRDTPTKCLETELDDFLPAGELQYFTVGILGAQKKGFTFEYPITRGHASQVWKPAKSAVHKGLQTKQPNLPEAAEIAEEALPESIGKELIKADHKAIAVHYAEQMDFSMGNEGDVLELLASFAMERSVDLEKYFVSGSVAYHHKDVKRTIGELDLIIAERDTCTIVAVGEVKLGVRNLSKAQSQLARFHNFLKDITNKPRAPFNMVEPVFKKKKKSQKKAS